MQYGWLWGIDTDTFHCSLDTLLLGDADSWGDSICVDVYKKSTFYSVLCWT